MLNQVPPIQWAAQSVALTLANKAVFSYAFFDFPWLCLGVQSAMVVVAVTLLACLRRTTPHISLHAIAEMFIPSVLFLMYQYSYARALRFISLPAYTVVKSLAPLVVTALEAVIFRESVPSGVFAALAASLVANVLTFESAVSHNVVSLRGYAWAMFHVLAHVFYVLSLRSCSGDYRATDKAYLANLLSLPFILPMAILNVETRTFVTQVEILPSTMLLPLAASFGLSAGCAVSVLAAFEAASSDTLRYFALFNKVAVVLVGAMTPCLPSIHSLPILAPSCLWLTVMGLVPFFSLSQFIFDSDLSPVAWFGVAMSIVSGYIFVYSKTESAAAASSVPRPIVSSPSLEMLLPSREDFVDDDIAQDTPGLGPKSDPGCSSKLASSAE